MRNKRVWKLALGLMLALPMASVAAGPGPDEGAATRQLLVGGKLMGTKWRVTQEMTDSWF